MKCDFCFQKAILFYNNMWWKQKETLVAVCDSHRNVSRTYNAEQILEKEYIRRVKIKVLK